MNAKGDKAGWSNKIALRSGYDFSSISIYPPTRIAVSQPGDPSEREADKIAEKVVLAPDIGESKLKESKLPTKESTQGLDERETNNTQIQPKLEKPYNPQSISSFSHNHQIDHLKGEPQILPSSVRSYFEARFQQDFGSVRLYTSAGATQLAQFFNARAFTLGQDIVFGAGQYSPYTREGKKLIAHELTHVLQHGNDRSAIYRKISFESPTFSHYEDFVEKVMHKKDPASTTPTFNGTMLADTKRGKTPEEQKKLYDSAGQIVVNAFSPKTNHYDGEKKKCAFDDFDVKVGANIMLPNEPQDKKWRGYFSGSEIPGCKDKGDVPVVITGDPDSASVYKILQNQEQEHVDELKRIYDSRLEPYFKMLLNLTATGDDSPKCQKALSDALGKKDTLMAKDFLKDWGDSSDNLDKGGRHTLYLQITPKDDCRRVEVVVKK